MTSDDNKQAADIKWRNAGIGLASRWACGACGKPQYMMLGRKLRRVRGVRTWVCAGCGK